MPLPCPTGRTLRPRPVVRLLPLALAMALPAGAATHTGPIIVEEGEQRRFHGDRVVLDQNGTALLVRGDGSQLTLGTSTIAVGAEEGAALRVHAGADAALQDTEIDMGTSRGAALQVSGAGSTLRGEDVRIHGGLATSNALVSASAGGVLQLQDSTVHSGGLLLQALGQDSRVGLSGGRITGIGATRLEASNDGVLELRDLAIDLAGSGREPFSGLAARNGGRIVLDNVQHANGMLSVNGGEIVLQNSQAEQAAAMLLGSAAQPSTLRLENSRLSSDAAEAINVNNHAQLLARDSVINLMPVGSTHHSSRSAVWLAADTSRAVLERSTINVHDQFSSGIRLYGGEATLIDSTIVVHDPWSDGIVATGSTGATGSRVSVDGGRIELRGEGSAGVYLGGSAAHARLDRLRIKGDAAGGIGVSLWNGATVETSSGLDIELTGAEANGWASFYSVAGDFISNATLDDADIDTPQGVAFFVDGNSHRLDLRGSRINQRGRRGALLAVADGPAADDSIIPTSRVDFSAAGSQLSGDVFLASETAALNLQLTDGSHWQGALVNLTENQDSTLTISRDSRWTLTGDSSVGTLNHAGTINFGAVDDAPFHQLTVHGDYHGQNGQLLLDTRLDGDDAPSSLLHIEGDSTGSAGIGVRNAGGRGAATVEGLRVVQVDGRSDAVFALQGRAVAGAYDYFLHQGSTSAPQDGHWYLRSSLADEDGESELIEPPEEREGDSGVPPVEDIIAPPDDADSQERPTLPPTTGQPQVLRPEAGVWAANLGAALSLFDLTLHERSGDADLGERDHTDGDHQAASWVRGWQRNTRSTLDNQLHNQSRQHVLQVGTELVRWGQDARSGAGVMLATAHSQQQVRSSRSGIGAQGLVRGRSVGAYATWRADAAASDGLYVDGWVQAAQLRSRVQGDALPAEQTRSRGLFAAIESGRSVTVHARGAHAVFLQPQVQMLYGQLRPAQASHVEDNGTVVRLRTERQLRSRIGLRLHGRTALEHGAIVQPFLAYDWTRRHGSAASVWMDDVQVTGGQPRDVQRLRAGIQVQVTPQLSGWGELQLEHGSGGQRGQAALIGVRYSW